MISYFPAISPDELAYSWFCRYYVHSGFFSSKSAMQELYCKRSDNPSKEFIGNLNPGTMEQIAKMYPLSSILYDGLSRRKYLKPSGRSRYTKMLADDLKCSTEAWGYTT